MSDGKRRITHVTEITGMTGDVVAMQDIFVFDKLGIDAGGRVLGRFRATGVSPKFAEKLKTSGIVLPPTSLSTRSTFRDGVYACRLSPSS